MALPSTDSFAGIIFEVENTPGGGTYTTRMCGFTDKGLNVTAATSSAVVPDCDDPESATWELSGVTSIAAEISLSGIAAAEDEAFWNQWVDSGLSKNVRYRKEGVGYRSGAMNLTAMNETVALGTDGNFVKRSITAKNASAFPWTSGDPA
jgi:hypothetical protein